MTTEKNDWKITTERYVGFIDIMGFKDMIMRETPSEIHEKLSKIAKIVNAFSNPESRISTSKWVKLNIFSDSFIICSIDDSLESFQSAFDVISIISGLLIDNGLPFKGAISKGVMTYDIENSIFFGQPLIDAYQLQDKLLIYGIVLSKEFENDSHMSIFPSVFTFETKLPFKDGKVIHKTLIPHPLTNLIFEDIKYREQAQKVYDKIVQFRSRTEGGLRVYIDNTIEFYENYKAINNVAKL